MTTKTQTEASVWTTTTKALAAALMLAAVMATSLLVPVPAGASAFPGANGKIVFSSTRTTGTGVSNPEGDLEIFSMNADGAQQARLTDNALVEEDDPSFSPDGSEIAFASNRFGGGDDDDFDILVMGADGSNPTNFTASRATDDEPAFSPDGKKIAFVSTRDDGDEDVFVMDAVNGTGQTDITLNTRTDNTPDWQPKAATFTVTTASDAGNGACDSTCTLREAFSASNAVLGQIPNTIKFNIPGSGVQTITPSSPLPPITRPVVVDGYTQPGASPNTLATGGTNAALKIELSGINTFGTGIALSASSDSVIRGLVINRFGPAIGIFDNFSGTSNTANNRIEGNFLGTDPTGKLARGNDLGVHLDGGNGNVVGGTTPAARNLISANGEGIELSAGTQGNKLLGNLIGTTASGTAPLGNEFWGVALFNPPTSNNEIGDGTAAGSNTIAFNERDGIEIDFGGSLQLTGNQISRNSIFSNGGLGIDLMAGSETDATNVSTPNDGDNPSTPKADPDGDTGANNLQNKPVLSSAKTSSTNTTITGKLNSTPNKTFKIEFFSNPSSTNEGKKFIGQKSVTTDASGNVTYTFSPAAKVPVGQTITATATDSSTRDTSEFSAPRTVATS